MREEIIKRLIEDRKTMSYLSNSLFLQCINNDILFRGRTPTIHSVINWFHLRNNNPVLEREFIKILEEKSPNLFNKELISC